MVRWKMCNFLLIVDLDLPVNWLPRSMTTVTGTQYLETQVLRNPDTTVEAVNVIQLGDFQPLGVSVYHGQQEGEPLPRGQGPNDVKVHLSEPSGEHWDLPELRDGVLLAPPVDVVGGMEEGGGRRNLRSGKGVCDLIWISLVN